MVHLGSILVLGAGELGIEVIKSIASRKGESTLTVLLRPAFSSSSKDAATIESLGCAIIRHDISQLDVDGLASVLKPYDAVVSCTGFAAGPGTQLKIAKAAILAKIRRFFPWQFGVDYDEIGRGSGQTLFDEQLDVRDLLRAQSEVDWVIVSTGVFMSFVFEDFFGVVEGVKSPDAEVVRVRALGSWDNGLTATAVEDIGKLTTAILFDDTVHHQVIHVGGDTFSYARLAETVERVTGGKVDRQLWTKDYLADDLGKHSEDTIRKYRVAFAAGIGVSWSNDRIYRGQSDVSVSDVEGWMRQNIVKQ